MKTLLTFLAFIVFSIIIIISIILFTKLTSTKISTSIKKKYLKNHHLLLIIKLLN